MENADTINEWLGRPINNQRDLILATAQHAFSEAGYRNTDMRTIAKQAGIGKTTIYKHFPSKEELFLAIVESNLSYIRDLTVAALAVPSSPWERIERAAISILSYIENNRGMLRILVQEAGEFNGEIQKRYISTTEKSLPMAESFYKQFCNEGNLRDVHVGDTLRLISKLIIGIAYTWSMSDEGSLVDEGLRHLAVLKQGLTNK